MNLIPRIFSCILFSLPAFSANAQNSNPWPTSGNVGIGTGNSPQAPLHILNNNNIQSILLESNSAGWGSGLVLKNTAAGGRTHGIYSSAFGALCISDNLAGVDRIHINNAGYTGIGTSLPAEKLHVDGRVRIEANYDNGNLGGTLILAHPGKTTNGAAKEWRIYNTGSVYGNSLQFWAYDNIGCTTGGLCDARFTIMDNGNVGIGTTIPQAKLAVNGDIFSKKVKVTQTGWPDYVFHKDYPLPTLTEVEQYIAKNNHLPGVPSAATIEKNGLDLGEGQVVLLRKMEELTLYLIEQNKKLEEQHGTIIKQQALLQQQQERIKKLEEKIN